MVFGWRLRAINQETRYRWLARCLAAIENVKKLFQEAKLFFRNSFYLFILKVCLTLVTQNDFLITKNEWNDTEHKWHRGKKYHSSPEGVIFYNRYQIKGKCEKLSFFHVYKLLKVVYSVHQKQVLCLERL